MTIFAMMYIVSFFVTVLGAFGYIENVVIGGGAFIAFILGTFILIFLPD